MLAEPWRCQVSSGCLSWTGPAGRSEKFERANKPDGAGEGAGRGERAPVVAQLAVRAGGRGGIRTHGGLAPTAVFKTAALNHSATLPRDRGASSRRRIDRRGTLSWLPA